MTRLPRTRSNAAIPALLLLAFVAGTAVAQAPPPLDLRLPAPTAQVDADAPAAPEDLDDYDAPDSATTVHGAFTTGIGYSKAYGNSTMGAAELDVSKQYDNGKTIDLHIDVMRSTGIPTVSPRCYGAPYCGY